MNKVHQNKVAKLRVFFFIKQGQELCGTLHVLPGLCYHHQTSLQTPSPPPMGPLGHLEGGWGKETADTSYYNRICLIAIWNEPVRTSLSTCHVLFSP